MMKKAKSAVAKYFLTYYCKKCQCYIYLSELEEVICKLCHSSDIEFRKKEKFSSELLEKKMLQICIIYRECVRNSLLKKEYMKNFDEEKTIEFLRRLQRMIDTKNFQDLTAEEQKVLYGVPQDVPDEIVYDEKQAGRFIWDRLPEDKRQKISPKDIELMMGLKNEYANKIGEFDGEGICHIKKEMAKRGKKLTLKEIGSLTEIETGYLRLIGAIEE